MTSEKMPADWAIERAREIMGWAVGISLIKDAPNSYADALGVARYIEAHEKPPVDRKLLCAREAGARWHENRGGEALARRVRDAEFDGDFSGYVEAITLWEEGFGK